MAARRGHCPEIPFESEPATISQDGQASLSRKSHYLESAGAEPAPATKGYSRPQNTRIAREDGLFSPLSTTTGINGDDMWLCDLKARYK
jgi:hypothetical protein